LPYDDKRALGTIDSGVAAVVIEPIQAEGGVRIPSLSFMLALRRQCDSSGALLIFDEVLTGFGRTGRMFALEHFGVTPDVVVLAKALGGGLPLGAFCASDAIIGTLSHNPPLGHITTFGGHPLSCAAGLAAIDAIVEQHLWDRAERIGTSLRNRLAHLAGSEITEVRGLGLLVGIEFARATIARRFVAESLARGIVINWTLNADRVVRLAPPLTITSDEIDFAVNAMAEALEASRPGA
jgi:acetylornithine/succinyldiaminopimelate/putrescine aminotransferase